MYRENRICPLGDRDEDKRAFEDALIELVDQFSESWLNLNSGHPLQALWHRRDILASIELLYLGNSIKKVKGSSPDQLRQNIKLLKSNDRGTIAGAVWEIILAAGFHKPPEQKSKLLGPRKPTYDIEVETINGAKTRISVKNFGQSKNDRNFINQFESLERIIEVNTINHIQMSIIREVNYPSQQEWDALKREVSRRIWQATFGSYPFGGWNITIRALTDEHVRAHTGLDCATVYAKEASYTLFMALPFYKNEDKNIESNLKEACLDLINKGSIESNISKNCLFIHLPEYVSLDDYMDWCNRFFCDNPTAPISYITLFQPVYVTDPDKDESFLAFNHIEISRQNRIEPRNKLEIEMPVGRSANKIRHLIGPDFEIPKHHYIMQSGHIHIDCGDITHGGKMKMRFDHGIITDAVATLNGEEFSVSCNFPPTTKLVLL